MNDNGVDIHISQDKKIVVPQHIYDIVSDKAKKAKRDLSSYPRLMRPIIKGMINKLTNDECTYNALHQILSVVDEMGGTVVWPECKQNKGEHNEMVATTTSFINSIRNRFRGSNRSSV